MKILIVTNHFLDSNGGGSFASRAFINSFAKIADECVLLYPDNGNSIDKYISRVKLIGIKNKKCKIGNLLDIYLGKINRFSEVIFSTIDEHNPDLIVFDNSRASAGYTKILKMLGRKVVTIHHNFEMEYYRGSKPSVFWRYPLLYFMKKAEKEAVLYSDLNLTLTPQDIELLQTHYDLSRKSHFYSVGVFEFQPNHVDDFSEIKQVGPIVFAITGNLSAKQTEISILPFFKNEYPRLQKRYPEAKVIIAGKNPGSNIRVICDKYKNIELIVNPVDMAVVINQADVYICPIAVGGGLKLRVMDGLKAGLPVVTHEVSARGYDVFKDQGVLFTYNSSGSFEAAVENVIKAYQSNEYKKNDIRALYNKEFSFDQGVIRLKGILDTFNLI
jgi:spore coat polysaccharide biosynthesis predicted glycosyltransferase SpsG